MIWLWAYLFIGSLYAAFATNWLNKNVEEGSSFTVGLVCFLLWPFIMFLNLILSGDDG